jgi:hypothetical protein
MGMNKFIKRVKICALFLREVINQIAKNAEQVN